MTVDLALRYLPGQQLWIQLIFQIVALAITLVMACLIAPRSFMFRPLMISRLDRIGVRPRLSLVFVFLFVLVSCFFMSLIHRPIPYAHDEFAYLLAADTFAEGRLTNPSPAFAEHFQSYHILVTPTYQAKYPPGQGLVMALGQFLTGDPLVGVWMSLAVACAAVNWMLQGFVPPRWAFLGAMLISTNSVVLVQWGESYWGGALAMFGGAMVFGALKRTIEQPRFFTSVALGVGAVVLVNSRPYEGLIATLPAAALLAWNSTRAHGTAAVRTWSRVILPLCLVLVPAGGWMFHYNRQVTGNGWTLPYQTWYQQQGGSILQTIGLAGRGGPSHSSPSTSPAWAVPPEHAVRSEAIEKPSQATLWRSRIVVFACKLANQAVSYFGVVLLIPFLVLPAVYRRPWGLFAIVVSALVMIAVLSQRTTSFPHYSAAVASLLMYLEVECLRQLSLWRRDGQLIWFQMAHAIPAIWFASFAVFLGTYWLHHPNDDSFRRWSLDRASIQRRLTDLDGQHLVIARFSPDTHWIRERVYNRATIDTAKVVWARDLGKEKNQQLIDHFPARRVWLLEVDDHQTRLLEFDGNTLSLRPESPGR